jgi:Flp pilus assembly protein TadG
VRSALSRSPEVTGRRRLGPRSDERGSAVVEFALVAPLILLLALAVVQVAIALEVRATLTSAAAEGARAAALAGSNPAAGVRRAQTLLSHNVAASVVRQVSASHATVDGLPVMAVRIDATLPLVGLLGPTAMTVVGHALEESA